MSCLFDKVRKEFGNVYLPHGISHSIGKTEDQHGRKSANFGAELMAIERGQKQQKDLITPETKKIAVERLKEA